MPEFRYTVDDEPPVSGFSLGHFDIVGNKRTVSTRGHRPDERLMVFLSAGQLLWDLTELMQSKGRTRKFVGTDSTFTLIFTRKKTTVITSNNGEEIDESPFGELARAAMDGAKDLLDTYQKLVAEDPKPLASLDSSIRKFSSFLESLA